MSKSSEERVLFPWERDGETLVVDTPEQTRVEFRIAPFGSRIVAAVLDRLLLAGVAILFLLVVEFGGLVAEAPRGPGYVAILMWLVWFFVSLFYYVWMELRWGGQTLGKRRLHLRTVQLDGRPITFGPSVVRNLARILDELPPLWLVPTLAPGRRRIGDFLAGTVVIDEGRPERAPRRPLVRIVSLERAWLGDLQFHFGAEVAERLKPDDLNLLEFLERRVSSAPEPVRDRTVREVAERYIVRLKLNADHERIVADPLRFLQELALFLSERAERW